MRLSKHSRQQCIWQWLEHRQTFSLKVALCTHQPQSYVNFRSLTLPHLPNPNSTLKSLIFTFQLTAADDVILASQQRHVKKQTSSQVKQRFDNGNQSGACRHCYLISHRECFTSLFTDVELLRVNTTQVQSWKTSYGTKKYFDRMIYQT